MPRAVKFLLDESDMPRHWYNLCADLPTPPAPMLHPGTGQPLTPDELEPIFASELIRQEMSTEREVEIPQPVREIYRQWRPSPLFRAHRLEAHLKTPAHIYYKYEGVSPAGSHKPNTAIPQAWYNREQGIKRLATETGAGQWGSSLAMACAMLGGIHCEVFMVRCSAEQKPYRKALMEVYGATVTASPSTLTQAGRAALEKDPGCPGSLGIAISEAVEVAASDPHARYALGSVLNHVLLHQSVIGVESMKQMELAGEQPDVIIGCTGGGSNFAGLAFPWLGDGLRHQRQYDIVAVEPTACPSLTKGRFAYDFGDTAHLTPLVKMHTLGSTFIPPPSHTGGLRYHGMAPLVSHVVDAGLARAVAVKQTEAFASAITFARVEGILPAPEASHAVAAVFAEAQACRESGQAKVILFNLCGHGHFDMQAYMAFLGHQLQDYAYPEEEIGMALAGLPVAP